MDGTLADSIGHYCRIAHEVTRLAGAPPVSDDLVRTLMGGGDPDLLRRLLPEDYPGAVETLARIVAERAPSWRRDGALVDPLPGCVEMLHDLSASGYRLGIATAGSRALPTLDRWGVRHLFSALIGREDVARRKPDPECVVLCLDRIDCAPEEAVYVGDSPIDMIAGAGGGTATVGVLTGTSDRSTLLGAGADVVLESAAGLAAALPPAAADRPRSR